MSGGSYEYKYQEIERLAEMLSPVRDKYQPIRDKMAEALRQIAKQCHDIEWIDSSDYGPEDWASIKAWLIQHKFYDKIPRKNV
jgi:hypothetical protein